MPPTYDYECQACEHVFEEFQSMSAPLLRKCPKCGKRRLRRLMGTGAGIIFKGSGFYETDYKQKQAPKAERDARAGTKPESKSESKSESKPESKAESKPESKSESKPKPESKPESRKGGKGKG